MAQENQKPVRGRHPEQAFDIGEMEQEKKIIAGPPATTGL
jgi:hypothetical protein